MNLRTALVMLLAVAMTLPSGCATVGSGATPAVPAVPGAPATPALPGGAGVGAGTTTAGGGGQSVTINQPPDPCCPHPTLWEFLGIKNLLKAINGVGLRLRNRLGKLYPGLEPKPPLLAITDPANQQSTNPAVKTAAGVKADEDAAEQKAKAINYLGTIGCGKCYPEIEGALLAALDDCTESVRFAAATAIREATGCACMSCKSTTCCGPKVITKLRKIIHDTDDKNCYIESSPRVRRMARLALAGCCGAPGEPTEPAKPAEGPAEGPVARKGKTQAIQVSTPKAAATEAPATPTPAAAEAAPAAKPGPVEIRINRGPANPAVPAGGCPCGRGGVFGSVNADPQRIVAVVNDEVITEQELCTAMSSELRAIDEQPRTPAVDQQREALIREHLAMLVQQKLLLQVARQDAPAAAGGVVPVSYQAEVDGKPQPGNASAASGFQDAQLIVALLNQQAATVAQPTELEVVTFYHLNAARYLVLDEVRLERWTAGRDHFATPEEARAALTELVKTPASLLGQKPQLLSRLSREDLGWKRQGDIQPTETAGQLFQAPIGAGPLFQTSTGMQLVRVVEQRMTRPQWDVVAPQVRRDLLEQLRLEAQHSFLQELQKSATIRTSFDQPAPPSPTAQPALSAVLPKPQPVASAERPVVLNWAANPTDTAVR